MIRRESFDLPCALKALEWFETPSTVEDYAHSVVNSICFSKNLDSVLQLLITKLLLQLLFYICWIHGFASFVSIFTCQSNFFGFTLVIPRFPLKIFVSVVFWIIKLRHISLT